MELTEKIISENHYDEFSAISRKPSISPSPLRFTSGHFPDVVPVTENKANTMRLWQRFQDDGNVSRCYSTGHSRVTTPNEDRYLAVTAKKKKDGAEHQSCPVSSLQLPVRQFQGSVYRRSLRAYWYICS
ncbi:uncharacterized protein TNCV_1218031 [Trichonephila clavipes]|nr:uncharacterized protein TNCV_1218031 [Trichonephila clavipes]